jgi:arylsulfatase A-like enzyme
MKRLGLLALILTIALLVGWQNRVGLLVWGMPRVMNLVAPVADNIPLGWQVGPQIASLQPAERPPNIILILADDMGFNDVSLYNGGAADGSLMTPGIDAIAQAGVIFNNGYAANAVCAPSRASILTGRYATRFGFEFTPFPKSGATIFQWMQDLNPGPLPIKFDQLALETLPPFQDLGMPSTEVTIAEVLRDAGYYTAHIGKWHLGHSNGMNANAQGFDDSLLMSGMLYLPEDDPSVVNAKRDNGIERMVWANARYAASFNGSEQFKPDGYLTDYYTEEAVQVIENNRNRPFFLYLAHWGIHNPLQALKADYNALAHIEDHHLRVYAAMIRSLDRSVARITQALEDTGLSENTLVIFTSDNGGASYIGLPDVNKPYRGWKLTHFEGGTHVPFMARWPARIQPGSRVDKPVHHVDLLQTMANAAGAQVPGDRTLDGIDLLPHARGEATGNTHDTLFWREGYHQSVLHRGWKLIRTDLPDHKRWLFHLAEDPNEQHNLAGQMPDRVAALEALLEAHNEAQAQPTWPSVVQSPQLIDKHGGEVYAPGDDYIYWPN